MSKPSTDNSAVIVIDPVVMMLLEILYAERCPHTTFSEERCLPWCSLCRDAALSTKEGTA